MRSPCRPLLLGPTRCSSRILITFRRSYPAHSQTACMFSTLTYDYIPFVLVYRSLMYIISALYSVMPIPHGVTYMNGAVFMGHSLSLSLTSALYRSLLSAAVLIALRCYLSNGLYTYHLLGLLVDLVLPFVSVWVGVAHILASPLWGAFQSVSSCKLHSSPE